jgi:hypothetical protein
VRTTPDVQHQCPGLEWSAHVESGPERRLQVGRRDVRGSDHRHPVGPVGWERPQHPRPEDAGEAPFGRERSHGGRKRVATSLSTNEVNQLRHRSLPGIEDARDHARIFAQRRLRRLQSSHAKRGEQEPTAKLVPRCVGGGRRSDRAVG